MNHLAELAHIVVCCLPLSACRYGPTVASQWPWLYLTYYVFRKVVVGLSEALFTTDLYAAFVELVRQTKAHAD